MCLLRGTDRIFIYNSTFCPHSVFMCFVWIWEQTAIISLYSINWLVCITETACVYCAVRTVSPNTIHVTVVFIDRGMAQTDNPRSPTPQFTNAPLLSSSTRSSDKEPEKSNVFFRKLGECFIENNFQLSSLLQVAPVLLLLKWGLLGNKKDESILNWVQNMAFIY